MGGNLVDGHDRLDADGSRSVQGFGTLSGDRRVDFAQRMARCSNAETTGLTTRATIAAA